MSSTKPVEIRIIGKTYGIQYTSGAPLDDDNIGELDPDKQKITIKKGQPLETEQDTFLHEIIHAIDHELNIGLREKQVRALATGFLAALKDNPKLVAYLRRKNAKP